MKTNFKLLIMFLLTLISFNFNFGAVSAEVENGHPLTGVEIKVLDERAKILSNYLAKYNSPMQYHAQDFIDAADKYGLDWRMLPSIAGVESTFGKRIPGGYNAYGWGVYGKNAIYFKSWRDGMFTVAKGLRENYLNKGLNDPYKINRIYAASPSWGTKVSRFMRDLEIFAGNYAQVEMITDMSMPDEKIAASSGQLAFKLVSHTN